MKGREPIWDFYGFKSTQEGAVVQEWFNRLDPAAQEEIINLITHLRSRPGGQWVRPDFDPLEGEGGISELRPRDIRTMTGNKVYRIYGFRGCPTGHCYTFLHGTDKEVSNDIEGKAIAKRRLREILLSQGGDVHKFDFSAESLEEVEKE
ncbi:MAG: hypothetical protein ACLP07_01235 [Terracidiphilus sp.]